MSQCAKGAEQAHSLSNRRDALVGRDRQVGGCILYGHTPVSIFTLSKLAPTMTGSSNASEVLLNEFFRTSAIVWHITTGILNAAPLTA